MKDKDKNHIFWNDTAKLNLLEDFFIKIQLMHSL